MKKIIVLCFIGFGLFSCKKEQPITVSVEDFHGSVDKVTEIMIHDIFSPPVASRIFAYPSIAAYEIVALNNPDYQSLVGQIKGLTPIPTPKINENINYQISALVAQMELNKKLIFSEDKMKFYRDSLYTIWKKKNEPLFKASEAYGLEVAEHIAIWMKKDNYDQTRTMSKFTVDTDNPERWQPTPPAYMDGIEPHWNRIRTFAIDSAQQFKPIPPPPFSMDKNSNFYKEVKEVYDISNKITAEGDTSEEVAMAKFWDCNPYASVSRGHLMFASKKISPGAHWMGIAKIACRKTNSNFDKTIYAYTKASIAMADAFISCWDEKYRSNLIRPETLINQYIDENWLPILQTPPFPEYTSGHSVVSGAASTVLTDVFGDNFAFADDTEVAFGLSVRNFSSFNQAAQEAAMSRMYGGIHYRSAVEIGITQGRELGAYVVQKLQMTTKKH